MPSRTSDYTPLEPVPQSRIHPLMVGVLIGLVVALVLGIVAIGLGIGLSVHSDESSSSTSTLEVLSPPIVNCIYQGPNTCGCASIKPSFIVPHIVKRILNGYIVTPNSWPWVVGIANDNENRLCSGFLVTYQHFITAAHCVKGKSKEFMTVYGGLQRLSSRWFVQQRAVAVYTYHPSYKAHPNSIGDIAVVKLNSSFDMDEKIGLCCLNWNLSLPAMNEHGAIVGWGSTTTANISVSHATEKDVSQQLRQAIVQVEDPAICNITGTTDRRFCAGYGTTDSCYGDSGGPFMTSVNNSWTCTGIVSGPADCGHGGIYTRVSFYRDFIEHALLTL